MEEPGFTGNFLSASRVVIWGLGLMGGSLAMALKGKCAGLVGVDADPATVRMACERGVVDQAYRVKEVLEHPQSALKDAGLIILAVPVRAILTLLEELPGLCDHPAVVLDLGSTKQQIMAAMAKLPQRFDPVGGHPMCGKEKSTFLHAETGLYQDAPFALAALERTSPGAQRLAEEVALAVGARPLWLDPAQHDRWVAVTSHAPFLIASALAQSAPEEVRPMVGPGFRGTARLAGSSPRMMVDILATNGGNIRSALDSFRAQLDALERLLEQEDYAALAEKFEAGAEQYRRLTEKERENQ